MNGSEGYVLFLDTLSCSRGCDKSSAQIAEGWQVAGLQAVPGGLSTLAADLAEVAPSLHLRVTSSLEQARSWLNQGLPHLVIMLLTHPSESWAFLHHCRTTVWGEALVIVALTHQEVPHWLHPCDNPGFDGFLVQPLGPEVLGTLIDLARIRRLCQC